MGAKQILVVEDNRDNLRLVRTLLAPLDARVTEVTDGLSAVEAAKGSAFDLVLLDIQLPVMDGYAVAKALRGIPHMARTPIVAVTSYAMPGDEDKAMDAGCSGYIEKPLNPETFLEQIRSFLAS